jgi:hypothetical protein
MLCEFRVADEKAQVLSLSTDRSDIGTTVQLGANMAAGKKIKQWGNKNDLPQYRDQILCDNNIIGELLDTKRNIAIGHGLMAYNDVYTDGKKDMEVVEMPAEIQAWLDESGFEDIYLDMAFLQWYKHSNVFAEFILDRKNRVVSVMCKDCKYIRAVEKVNGNIPGYVYNPVWKVKFAEDEKVIGKAQYIPAYNKEKPAGKFMLHIADNVFSDGYYAIPAYWGGVEWIRTSNAIPVFHESNLKNGYSIRFVVKYPEGYFLNKYEYDQASASNDSTKVQECVDKERTAKQAFVDKINALLAGASNAGRAVFLEDVKNEITNKYDGVTIEAIEYDMKDKALLELYAATNQANISAQGIHPTLANIETQGKLSSGSEMRNAFLFYVLTRTPRPRKQILKAFDIVCKLNGWKEKYPKMKFTFEDFRITKLDEDKSGIAPMDGPEGEETKSTTNENKK